MMRSRRDRSAVPRDIFRPRGCGDWVPIYLGGCSKPEGTLHAVCPPLFALEAQSTVACYEASVGGGCYRHDISDSVPRPGTHFGATACHVSKTPLAPSSEDQGRSSVVFLYMGLGTRSSTSTTEFTSCQCSDGTPSGRWFS